MRTLFEQYTIVSMSSSQQKVLDFLEDDDDFHYIMKSPDSFQPQKVSLETGEIISHGKIFPITVESMIDAGILELRDIPNGDGCKFYQTGIQWKFPDEPKDSQRQDEAEITIPRQQEENVSDKTESEEQLSWRGASIQTRVIRRTGDYFCLYRFREDITRNILLTGKIEGIGTTEFEVEDTARFRVTIQDLSDQILFQQEFHNVKTARRNISKQFKTLSVKEL